MIKLLIADDEPLVQIGIKSMLDWERLGIEICGIAANGEHALELIEETSPQIVITDIRMPVMNGLELIKLCSEKYGRLPLFIVLTSYEEFGLVKEAIHYEVIEYLVKLELSGDSLKAAVDKAVKRLEDIRKAEDPQAVLLNQSMSEKFFMRLLYNLFDSREQFELQARDLKFPFQDFSYQAACCEICESDRFPLTREQLAQLYSGCLQMIRDVLTRYSRCHLVSLDQKHFAVIFCLPLGEESGDLTARALGDASSIVHTYFNVNLRIGAGTAVSTPFAVSESYQEARESARKASDNQPVISFSSSSANSLQSSFNLSIFKRDMIRSFEEFDTDVLSRTLSSIIELFASHPNRYLQAIDGACNIMYLAMSLLPEGEVNLSEIFEGWNGSYRSIYRCSSVEQITVWMETLRDGLCEILKTRKKTYKDHIVTNVKHYINDHIEERLTLNEVSDVFGISHNYLSVLFKKNCGIGFSEYITQMKVTRSKAMLLEENLKIYEVADRLGFETSCYFSKVFKKVEGVSPREFLQEKTLAPEPEL